MSGANQVDLLIVQKLRQTGSLTHDSNYIEKKINDFFSWDIIQNTIFRNSARAEEFLF